MRFQLVRIGQADCLHRDSRRLAGFHPNVFIGRIILRQPHKETFGGFDAMPADSAHDGVFLGAFPRRSRILDRIASAAVQQAMKAGTCPKGQVALFQQQCVHSPHRQVTQYPDTGCAAADNDYPSFFHSFLSSRAVHHHLPSLGKDTAADSAGINKNSPDPFCANTKKCVRTISSSLGFRHPYCTLYRPLRQANSRDPQCFPQIFHSCRRLTLTAQAPLATA